ncbi:MAG: hypothetical protein AAF974_06355 [Cyanobacteria bacterium P01_E01_bin.34]
MLRHALFSGIATVSLLLAAPAALATPAQTRAALSEAVDREDWSLAMSLVDRLIDEQGVSQDLLTYRSHLQQFNTNEMLAELDTAPAIELSSTGSEAALARELARERQRQAELAAREERLAAREVRREQRNQERLQRAEERYLRALERESLARTNALNTVRTRRTICLSSWCGYRRGPTIIRDLGHHNHRLHNGQRTYRHHTSRQHSVSTDRPHQSIEVDNSGVHQLSH